MTQQYVLVGPTGWFGRRYDDKLAALQAAKAESLERFYHRHLEYVMVCPFDLHLYSTKWPAGGVVASFQNGRRVR